MKTFFRLLGLLLLFALLLLVFLAGYLGFLPGISSLLGTDKPRDLGVHFTEADRASGRAKSGVVYESLPAETPLALSIQRFGQRKVTTEFTNTEISALMNNRPWRYWPYQNVQVKFNADGSGEISGVLLKDKLVGYGPAIDAPKEAVDFIQKFLPANPIFYLKMKASLAENKVVVFEPQQFEIGRLPLPVGIFLSLGKPLVAEALAAASDEMLTELSKVQNKRQLIIDYINRRLNSITGFYAKKAYFAENKLVFDGSLSEKEATVR